MNPRSARQIRHGIQAAYLDISGIWQRKPLRHRLEWSAYHRTIARRITPGERKKLAEMRILAAQGRRR